MAMLRGSMQDQRGKRSSIDTGTGEKRLGGPQRAAHMSRGSFVDYHEDLGVSTTAKQAGLLRQEEADFQKRMASQQSALNKSKNQLAAARDEINAAAAKLPGYKEALNTAWRKTESSFIPVQVVDPSGTKVEAVYKLPKSAIPKLQEQLGGFSQAWVNDGKAYNVSVKHSSGRIRGQEIHEAMIGTVQGMYADFTKQTGPSIAKQIAEGSAALDAQRAKVSAAESSVAAQQGLLTGTKQQREKMWSDVRGNYEKKKATLAQILGNLKVEKGGKKDNGQG